MSEQALFDKLNDDLTLGRILRRMLDPEAQAFSMISGPSLCIDGWEDLTDDELEAVRRAGGTEQE